ncbi:MAG: aromatic aminobenezylarsenical efflux permease ArsG family transporter [bacterium]
MGEFLFGAGSALWLGILTSISPCPLAANIAAISFIGNRLGSTRQVMWSGFLYTLGRMIAYLALGILTVAGIMSIPGVSNFLQQYMNKLLGPLLIIVGAVLLELIRINISGWSASGDGKVQKAAERGGIWGAGLLGILFALSFCPISAALFFGSLIPLSVRHKSILMLPSLYGLGTGLPVMAFAILIALGTRAVGRAFNMLTRIEWWARRITGVIFIAVGIYYSLIYIFGVL